MPKNKEGATWKKGSVAFRKDGTLAVRPGKLLSTKLSVCMKNTYCYVQQSQRFGERNLFHKADVSSLMHDLT